MSPMPNKILIADDVASVRDTLGAILSDVDGELSFAVNGLDCLAKAAETLPDLVLLDVTMPEMDGLEVCRRLRADPKLNVVPVIMVTALDDAESRLQGLEAGADDFISKPVDALELRARVRTILRLNRYRRLADEQSKFQQLVEHMMDGVALGDEDGRLIEWNSGQERITGLSQAEVSGRFVWEIQYQLLPEEDRSPLALERMVAAVCSLLSPEGQANLPNRSADIVIQRPDGQRRRVQTSTFSIPTKAGCRVGIVTRDMTELKQIEEAMNSQTRLWERTMGSLRNAIFVISTENNQIIDCNPAASNLFGYSREELLGRPTDILHVNEAALAEFRRHLHDAVAKQGFLDDLEFQMKRKDGIIFPTGHSVAPVTGERGQPGRWVSVVRDNTRHKEALAEIQALNQRLEDKVAERSLELNTLYKLTTLVNQPLSVSAILEHALVLTIEASGCTAAFICLLDDDPQASLAAVGGRPRPRLSLAAQQGLSEAVVQGLNPAALEMALTGQVIQSGQTVLQMAVSRAGPTGILVPWGEGDYLGLPMRVRGRVVGVLSLLQPAKQKLTTEEIEFLSVMVDQIGTVLENVRLRQGIEAMGQQEERQRLARDLHDSVIQDLYSLSLIAAAAQNMVHSTGDVAVAQHLAKITTMSKRIYRDMRLLIHALRPSILEEVGLVEALRLRLRLVEERVGIRAQLAVSGNTQMPLAVEAELYHIAQEALNNALKHALATVVMVRLVGADQHIQLEICDDGQGFDLTEAARHGGVGLASLQERVRKQGGEISISSVAGKGTCVQVHIARY